MVRLAQKIWYVDGSSRVEYIEADSAAEAFELAYSRLDGEIAVQWAEGRVRVARALCAETDLVEAVG